jgi:hypothetical protein
MPSVFAAHGAPILLDDAAWVGELAAWARQMPGNLNASGSAAASVCDEFSPGWIAPVTKAIPSEAMV